MLPMWFFIVWLVVIAYLLYVTRTTEETFVSLSKNQFRKFHFWMKELTNR